MAAGGGGGGGVSFGTYATNGAANGGAGGAGAATAQGVGGDGTAGANTNASAGGGGRGTGATLSAGGTGGALGAHSYPGGSGGGNGASGAGGAGGTNLSNGGGGGGGGYFGGGGGGAGGDNFNFAEGGGGGGGAGSSWANTDTSGVAITPDSNSTPLVQITYEARTKVSLAASKTATAHGESVNVTATVLDAQGNDPTGTVQFVLNGVSWGSPVALSNNQASITILLGPGSYTVGALFTGDPGFADSSGSLSVLVAGAPFSRGPGSPTGLLAGLLGFGLVLAGAGAILARRPSGV